VTHTPHPDAIARAIAERVDHLEVAGVDVAIRWHLGRLEAIAHSEGNPVAHYRITADPWDDAHGTHGYVADQATLDATGTTVTLMGGPWRRGRVEDSRALDVIESARAARRHVPDRARPERISGSSRSRSTSTCSLSGTGASRRRRGGGVILLAWLVWLLDLMVRAILLVGLLGLASGCWCSWWPR
jgi:hypothetical protein